MSHSMSLERMTQSPAPRENVARSFIASEEIQALPLNLIMSRAQTKDGSAPYPHSLRLATEEIAGDLTNRVPSELKHI